MDVPTRDVNDMSQDELLFHYFKMMDVDKNARLDGTELVASIIHYSSRYLILNHSPYSIIICLFAKGHSHGAHGHSHNELLGKIFSDEEFSTQIDPVLANDDLNKDGYIDYPEFIYAQQKTDIKVSVS